LTKEGSPLTITGTGEQRRDFTYVDDICDGLILMSETQRNGEIFNLGTGFNHSINEVAAMFGGEVHYIDARPGEARETLADLSLARSIGYEPKVMLESYVRKFLNSLPQA